jgi:hypothetical protein
MRVTVLPAMIAAGEAEIAAVTGSHAHMTGAETVIAATPGAVQLTVYVIVPATVSVKTCLPVKGIAPVKGGLLAGHAVFVLRLEALQVEPAEAVHVSVIG